MGGGHINGWLVASDEVSARARAADLVAGYGWRVLTIDNCSAVERADYDGDREALRYFGIARIVNNVPARKAQWAGGEPER